MVQPSLPGRDWRLGLYIFPAVETADYFQSSLTGRIQWRYVV
ncbi:hypothetical protein Cabys_2335 [Caldithrix abyssi DSM 13497]|uniref:Uncharacterized protein n=1 Tax=Caldithrix abyssi DSM 13497 TaxID=880073 RepID=A0A1J1C9K6_CALAY|nr:hypothetical protein Cabys_2335 [Caldithrix abyssi DSM 13497]